MAPSATSTTPPNGQLSRPRVLIPEKISPDGIAILSKTLDIDERGPLTPDELLAIIPSYDALIIRSETKVTTALLAAATKLKVVARAGVGVDNVDIDAATKLGVIVVNSPSGNIVAAAEHTIALLLATARNISAASASLMAGKWARSKLVGVEVSSKTLGIIGLGKVGIKVARMAKGLGMKVVAMDPFASPEIASTNGVTLIPDLLTLLPMVDFLTIHTPLIASTLDLIGSKELQMMKPTARILNVARGGVYNEQALLDALDSGVISGAGLDVFTSEPPLPDSPAAKLTVHPRVVATPHLGASTVEAQENVSLDVCVQVLTILSGGLPTSAVNTGIILPEEYKKLQPFVKLVEKMGDLHTQHYSVSAVKKDGAAQGGKVYELIYEGELASISNTRPLFAALVKGLTASISDSGGRDVNIVNSTLVAKERGISINESQRREASNLTYASQVTLRSVGPDGEQAISGYVSGKQIHISRLDRFTTNFIPEGTLLICHNYDSPGKIGGVGSMLGKRDVNIKFMSVASIDVANDAGTGGEQQRETRENEALMILGVDGLVDAGVERELAGLDGILDVSVVRL